jgi:hypothetical protein
LVSSNSALHFQTVAAADLSFAAENQRLVMVVLLFAAANVERPPQV